MADKKIPVVEMFGPVIQGEGALTGHISYFIRTGGCPYRCDWCDSMHAVDPQQIKKGATRLTPEEIVEKVHKLTDKQPVGQWMTLSGGDPCMWDLEKVCVALRLDEMKICVETQGSSAPSWLSYVDLITCSPKPPSSLMNEKVDYDIIDRYHTYSRRIVLKVVIFDKADLRFAQDLKARYPKTPFYLSVGTPPAEITPTLQDVQRAILKRYLWLTEQVVSTPELHGVTIGPQMHTLIYGHKQGV